MTFILDPNNAADEQAWEGIKDLAGISAATLAINTNPLFVGVENLIITALPDANIKRTGQGVGRSYPDRPIVITALQFITAAWFKRGGGETATSESIIEGSGAIRSIARTVLGQPETITYDVGSRSSSENNIGTEDRADWLEEQGRQMLIGIGADFSELDADVFVVSTESRVKFDPDDYPLDVYTGRY